MVTFYIDQSCELYSRQLRRSDGTAGSFKASDGTNTATVAYNWVEDEVVTVAMQADGDVMRVGVV